MKYQDYAPDRLSAALSLTDVYAKQRARSAPNDELAVGVFSGRAKLHLPFTPVKGLTLDIEQARAIDVWNGTNISAGLELAEKVLFEAREPRAVQNEILLLTDGAHNAGLPSPVEVAERLKSKGVTITVIGIGRRECVDPEYRLDEPLMIAIASRDVMGRPRYSFVGDRASLVKQVKDFSNNLVRR